MLCSLLLFLSSCQVDVGSPGKPIIDFAFNGELVNKGMLNVFLEGDEFVQYHSQENDTCFNLSASAKYRVPLKIYPNRGFSLNDYNGFTVSLWVKKGYGDNEAYTILSQQEMLEEQVIGWEIRAEENGSWSWALQDTLKSWTYKPTAFRQAINDKDWHHLAFSYHGQNQECRLYFDGTNVAVYSLEGNVVDVRNAPIILGLSPRSPSAEVEVFNGFIDDFKMWSRPLLDDEIKQLHFQRTKLRHSSPPIMDDQLKVMTWSIWQGGIHEGKYVGPERIANVISSSEADVIMLQEMAGIGPWLADKLKYYYYQRSEDIGVLSRYPLAESNNVYRPRSSGCIRVELGKAKSVYACPVWLSPKPKMGAYIKSNMAHPDSIVLREMESRGKEITFVLSELRRLQRANTQVPFVLGGGFNSGSHLDWTEGNKHNYSGLVVPFPVSIQIEKSGFSDSYRSIHSNEVDQLGRTWSPKFPSAYPDRKDYIYFKGDRLLPIGSYVIEDHMVSFPSDHAAVVTVFEWQKKL